jgi:hypothetical protein
MGMLRADDVLLVLAENSQGTVSLIQRRLRRVRSQPRVDASAVKAS